MIKKPGGYQNLFVYQLAVLIYDLNALFCQQYLFDDGKGTPTRRTVDQMTQAARSGKQNIVEGSLEKSSKLNINLNSVSRSSYGELLEDYKDFLRTKELAIWAKDDPRVTEIRAIRISPTDKSNWPNTSTSLSTSMSNLARYARWTNSPESFANLMISLISIECYLLDRLLKSLEDKFISEGGYSENLFKKRLERKKLDKLD